MQTAYQIVILYFNLYYFVICISEDRGTRAGKGLRKEVLAMRIEMKLAKGQED